MKMLFVCNQNKHRSKTAEEIFKNTLDVKSAGLYNNTPINKEQLQWCDIIVVMEEEQRIEISKRFPKEYLQKRILCFNVSDNYHYMQPELIEELRTKFFRLTEDFSLNL